MSARVLKNEDGTAFIINPSQSQMQIRIIKKISFLQIYLKVKTMIPMTIIMKLRILNLNSLKENLQNYKS